MNPDDATVNYAYDDKNLKRKKPNNLSENTSRG